MEARSREPGRRAGLNGSARWIPLIQAILAGCAVLMSVWARIPWPGLLGLVLLGGSALAAGLLPRATGRWVWKGIVTTAWLCTLLVPATLLLTEDRQFTFERYVDQYYAVLAWLIAVAILPATHGALEDWHRPKWKLPIMVWAFIGGLIWLVTAYQQNQPAAFFVGLFINVALLVLWKAWFHLPGWTIQLINTLILVLVGLPLADVLFHPAYRLRKHTDLRQRLYSCESAMKDPAGYATWWNMYLKEVDSLEKDILKPDPDRSLPYRLRPGSQGMLFQSRIVINSLGFRGAEIHGRKGGTYRIVALGESTTFGITLNAQDQPWPELLEQIIRERLKPSQPVEVINAGVPGYALPDNLFRFAKDILPLQPDLVLSYHGINGFPLLNPTLPSNLGPPPPRYRERPVHLLADCEYRFKLLRYRRHQRTRVQIPASSPADPLASFYADAYRRLIELAQTNHFRLAVGNFSMAVNAASDPKFIRCYQAAYPTAPALIEANAAHSRLLQALARQHPEVCFVDTHPHLDGECPHFLDLVHFAPAGDRQLAENFFAGIRKILEQDLGRNSTP